jgi:hypothetical protein
VTSNQDRTRQHLQDWTRTKTTALDHDPGRTGTRQANHDHVMNSEPDQRLRAASDTVDEILDWNAGRGHFLVHTPGLPAAALDAVTLLGFTPEQIAAALHDHIDEDGNVATTGVAAAVADLISAPGTQDAYATDMDQRASSREAIAHAQSWAHFEDAERDTATRPDPAAGDVDEL